MTVRELILKLSKLPPDEQVKIRLAHDDHVQDISNIVEIEHKAVIE